MNKETKEEMLIREFIVFLVSVGVLVLIGFLLNQLK